MLLREASMDLESAMAAETEIQAACMQDPNFREAYDAFVAKRPAAFPRVLATSAEKGTGIPELRAEIAHACMV
jgi:hypothetical protein